MSDTMTLYRVHTTPHPDGWDMHITGPNFDHRTYTGSNIDMRDLCGIARTLIAGHTNTDPATISVYLTFNTSGQPQDTRP